LLLFIARAVDGLTGGNISVANAYLADVSGKEDRKKNFGQMSAAANVGFIVGPALAGILGATALGISLPIMAAILVSLLSLCTIAFGLKDVVPKTVTSPANEDTAHKVLGIESKNPYPATPAKTNFLAILKLPYIAYFLVLYFLIFLGFNFFYVAFPLYVVQELRWNVLQLGIFFAVLSGVMVIVQGPVLAKLSSHIPGSKLVIAGNLLLAVSFALFCSSSPVLLYLGLVFFAFGNGISWPSFLALLSNASDDRYQGVVQGFASSTGSLASIIGLVSGAFLYKIMGPAIFLVTTSFMALIAVASYWLIGIEKKTG
jgi:MFS transporter, DHA1 family, tetracycline resistance protein